MKVLDSVVGNHPTPWSYDEYTIYDADGADLFNEMDFLNVLVEAINKLYEAPPTNQEKRRQKIHELVCGLLASGMDPDVCLVVAKRVYGEIWESE